MRRRLIALSVDFLRRFLTGISYALGAAHHRVGTGGERAIYTVPGGTGRALDTSARLFRFAAGHLRGAEAGKAATIRS